MQQPASFAGSGEAFLTKATEVTSILQLVAYLGAVAAWAYVVPTLKRMKTAKQNIEGLPPGDQLVALQVIFGPIPANISSEQWLRDRRQRLLLVAFMVTLVAIVIGVLAYSGIR
jgi:hypothetical protein